MKWAWGDGTFEDTPNCICYDSFASAFAVVGYFSYALHLITLSAFFSLSLGCGTNAGIRLHCTLHFQGWKGG
jgi:hypothetical protein